MINFLNKAVAITFTIGIILCLCIAQGLQQQHRAERKADRAEVTREIEAARATASNRDIQKAILQDEIDTLAKAMPATALQEIKAPAVMKRVSGKVRS